MPADKNKLERAMLQCDHCGQRGGLMMDGVELSNRPDMGDTCAAHVYLACDCCGRRFAVVFSSHGGTTSLRVAAATFDNQTSLRVRSQAVMLEWDRNRPPGSLRLGEADCS